MAAKAPVPVEALPCIHRFGAMGPSYEGARNHKGDPRVALVARSWMPSQSRR